MTREEIVKMYIYWAYGLDETIHQSDYLCECFESGYSPKEIEKEGDRLYKNNLS